MNATPSRIFSKLLLWLNILSLDAPLVAVVWQDFFARSLGVKLPATPRLVLGLSIWLAYAADRWLDGWKIPPGAAMTPRHRFAQKYRVPLAWIWVVVLLANLALSCFFLPFSLFERGLALVLGVAVYFALNQWPATKQPLRGFKELSVGILFAAGTAIFITPPTGAAFVAFWWACSAWCLLAFLNCYAIACWEVKADRSAKQESIITRWPFLACRLKFAAFLVGFFALLPTLSRFSFFTARLGCAVAASSAGLALLDCWSNSLDGDFLRTAADLVLFTPLIFRFFPFTH